MRDLKFLIVLVLGILGSKVVFLKKLSRSDLAKRQLTKLTEDF